MEPLGIATALFADLGARRVRYVHWKSNEHLGPALSGESDLDLLIDPADEPSFSAALLDLGFIGMKLPRAIWFPGRAGYLGLDGSTGGLLHLDVHQQLVLGQQNAKNHHLPVEGWLMTDASEQLGVRVPEPGKELLILYIRVVLKTTLRQRLRAARSGESPVPGPIREEISWLSARSGDRDLARASTTAGLGITAEELLEFRRRGREDRLDWRFVGDRKRSLLRRLGRFRRQGRLPAFLKMILVRVRRSRPLRRAGLGVPPKKLLSPAPLIALVGPDGAGKTRLSQDLTAWLSWKLATHHVYFGQPRSSLVFRALNKPGSVLRHRGATSGDAGARRRGVMTALTRLFEPLKWTYLARRRYRLYRRSVRRCREGEIVIAERYPLEEFHDMPVAMDGPRLDREIGWWPRLLAGYERRKYQAIGRPGLILALNAPVQVLRSRKDDLGMGEHTDKVESVRRLAEDPGVAYLDAARPYSEVLLRAKELIWKALRDAS